MVKKISLVILIIGYLVAGANHFISPSGYIRLIPYYLPNPVLLNILAGLCEITFAIMLIFKPTRNWGAFLIVLMLIAFLPVHITMAQDAPLWLGRLRVTPAMAWARLLFQPVLMAWASWHITHKH